MAKIIPSHHTSSDKASVHAQREVKRNKSMHTLKPYRGHTLFEVDIDNEVIRIINLSDKAAVVDYSSGKPSVNTSTKVTTKNNCLYISALNVKNLIRLILKAGGKDVSNYTIERDKPTT